MAQQKQLNRNPRGLGRTEGGAGAPWRRRMKPRNTEALRRFLVLAPAGCLSSSLVDESKAAHATTNILHLLIPLCFILFYFFEACTSVS